MSDDAGLMYRLPGSICIMSASKATWVDAKETAATLWLQRLEMCETWNASFTWEGCQAHDRFAEPGVALAKHPRKQTLSASLAKAADSGAAYAVIVGLDEAPGPVGNEASAVRDMQTGEQWWAWWWPEDPRAFDAPERRALDDA